MTATFLRIILRITPDAGAHALETQRRSLGRWHQSPDQAECGLGWTLRNHVQRGVVTGNTQLTHRNSDGQRSSVMLPIPFEKANGSKLVNRVVAIAGVMNADPTKSLADAAAANPDVEVMRQQPKIGKPTGWKAIQAKFLATKGGQRAKQHAGVADPH